MTKIVYVAGWGRSGTTLMDNVLGQASGCVSTGELHNLWQRGLIEGRQCGCGRNLRECEFWQRVFEAGYGGADQVDPHQVVHALESIRTRHLPRLLRLARNGQLLRKVEYAPILDRLYKGIADAASAEVVIDSSKAPVDAVIAAGLPDHDVFVVHMVRDPRAVAFSWLRRRKVPDKAHDQGLLRRVGIVRSTLVWQLFNLLIASRVRAAVGPHRYLRVSYEDFAGDPERVLDRVFAFADIQPEKRPRLSGHTMMLQPSHTASGNPNRFDSGPTRIELDQEWTSAMPVWRRSLVSIMAVPTLWAMGYSWRVK